MQPLATVSVPASLSRVLQLPSTEPNCRLDTIQQEMERLPQGTRRLAVQLRLDLDPLWLWSALTDYESLAGYIPNLAVSRLLWRRGSVVGLEQVGTQQFCGLRFSASVELELEELPDQGRLEFRMVRGDFRRFEGPGSWAATPTAPPSSTTSRCRASRACRSA